MKTNYYLLCALFCAVCMSCSNNNKYLLSSCGFDQEGHMISEKIYEYDEQGEKTVETLYTHDISYSDQTWEKIVSFFKDNLIIKQQSYQIYYGCLYDGEIPNDWRDCDNWGEPLTTRYEYDRYNRLLRKVEENYANRLFKKKWEYSYFCNTDNSSYQETEYSMHKNGRTWQYSHTTIYFVDAYSSKGNVVMKMGKSWKENTITLYQYDNEGRIIMEESVCINPEAEDPEGDLTYKEVYKYNDKGELESVGDVTYKYEYGKLPNSMHTLSEEKTYLSTNQDENEWIYGTWKCNTPYGTIEVVIQENGQMYDGIEGQWYRYKIEGDKLIECQNGYISTYKIDRCNQRFDAGEPGVWFKKVSE